MSQPPSAQDVYLRVLDVSRNTVLCLNLFHGDALGIFKKMRGQPAMTAEQIAKLTNLDERYLTDWLLSMASNGILQCSDDGDKFLLDEVHAQVLADENSPFFASGLCQTVIGLCSVHQQVQQNFRTGAGIRWGNLGNNVGEGTARFFGTQYRNNLTSDWIPNMDQPIVKKLQQGALVGDIGCGYGISTMLMAKAFPNSTFIGMDYDQKSISRANEVLKSENLPNCSFTCLDFKAFAEKQGKKFDLLVFLDCFHDMSDPQEVIKSVKMALNDDGAVLQVEPRIESSWRQNKTHPGFQIYSGIAPNACLQVAKADSVGHGPHLGPIVSTELLVKLWKEGGFQDFKVLNTKSPFHRVIQIKKGPTPAQ